jgi:hypothetical protein
MRSPEGTAVVVLASVAIAIAIVVVCAMKTYAWGAEPLCAKEDPRLVAPYSLENCNNPIMFPRCFFRVIKANHNSRMLYKQNCLPSPEKETKHAK